MDKGSLGYSCEIAYSRMKRIYPVISW